MKYDVIIVGAGAAGAILAARLSQDPARQVLLLEAGPDYPSLDSLPDDLKYGYGPDGILTVSHDWGYTATASPKAQQPLPRGKVTGGSSSTNAQVFLRGVPEDFAAWCNMGNDRWTFDQILPYYRRLETDLDVENEFHGHDGPIRVRRYADGEWRPDQAAFYTACRAAGFPDCPDHNRPYTTGVGPFPLNNHQRIRQSTLLCYLNPARRRSNLTIRANVSVRQILFHVKQAVGVAAEVDGQQTVFNGDQIILCGGAIGSPHLLLLSGVGPADQLQRLGVPVVADLPGVGQNLRDHPAVNMLWHIRPEHALAETTHYHQVGLRYTAQGSDLPNDMIVYIGALPQDHTLLLRPTINLQLSAGELKLVANDPSIAPQLDYRYLSEPFDRQRLGEAVRLCRELVEGGAFAAIIGERIAPLADDFRDAGFRDDDALTDWLLRAVNTGHHSSGTCKMGPVSDPLAVVDQTGRVYGVDNLRVADAAIMPDCVRANTNATVMMMAEYLADLIQQEI